ncbi:MAG: zinc-ribbon domain-containing protein [Candidatus Dadabacteria bacterium]|nr:zinc-ribbon domain-containing protein [Candidatus Dadabacteria bacterium]
MVIECENCKRKFRLDDSRIQPPGSSVRCSKCGHIFFVSKAEDFSDESKLEPPQETLLFEDLKEEIVTEEKSNDYLEIEEPLSGGSSDITQAEMSIRKETDETDSDIVDLPTEHDENLEEFIEKNIAEDNKADIQSEKLQGLEEQETNFDLEQTDSKQETKDSIQSAPELFEAGDNEESSIVSNELYTEINLEEENSQEIATASLDNIPNEDMNIVTNIGEEEFDQPYNEMSESTSRTHIPKSGAGFFAKIIYTFITIAALFVIFIASLVILINAEILPKGTLSNLTALVESIIPIELNNTETDKVIITEHSGRWMNTVNGQVYIVSGFITNESQVPVHYVKLKSKYIAAEKIQFEDIFYAGNTFTDNELKVSPIENILSKLKQKNGDIDVNNSRKLAGLNYNIQPGESIPFFTVFPADGRILGLKYNLQIIGYKDSSSN